MAAIHNIIIDKGADFKKEFTITSDDASFDFSAHNYFASIRRDQDDAAAMVKFTVAEVDGSSKVTLTLTEAQTSALTTGHAHWDLLQVNPSSGDRQRILEGEVVIAPYTTRKND